MDVLYYSPGSASLCVHWLLIEIGRPHELRRVDLAAGEQRSDGYRRLNPAGVVPTLVLDGEVFNESGAMVLMLADRYPDAGLMPSTGTASRQRAYQWLLLMANGLQPPFRTWFYPHEPAGEGAKDAAKDVARQRIEAFFDRVEAHLAAHGPYLLGERVSAPDFFLAMLCRWSRNMPKPATEWPALRGFIDRMRARPSFKLLCEREALTEWLA
ncbi:glutathione S-transferase family protein [Silanimonas algicola]